jgi:hypothetical protein
MQVPETLCAFIRNHSSDRRRAPAERGLPMSIVQPIDDATDDETQIRALIVQGDQAHCDKDAGPPRRPLALAGFDRSKFRAVRLR